MRRLRATKYKWILNKGVNMKITKKILLVGLMSIFTSSTFAKTVHFNCVTAEEMEDNGKVHIQFDMNVDSSGKYSYVDPDKETIFKVKPKDAQAVALNENGSIYQDDGKTVTFFGDADGFVLVYLTLYRNSDLRHGYIKYTDGGVGLRGKLYSKIECDIKNIR